MRARKLYPWVVSGLLVGLVAMAPAQPGLGGIPWTHDLSVDQLTLQYPGANASATARAYSIEPNTEVDILVTVKNRSSNPSRPYRIDFRAGGQSIGSLTGPSVPSQGEKLLSLKWKPAQAGQGDVEAQLSFTSNSAASKAPCADCKSSRSSSATTSSYSSQSKSARCSYPYSCTVGSMGAPCSCHPTEDDPQNNIARAAYQVSGAGAITPGQASGADGIDLQVDSCHVQASVAKMGTYEAFVTISNQGNRPHSGMIDVDVTVGSLTRTVTFRGGLKPGESKTEIVEFTKAGRAKAVVDPKNTIKEAREDNNSSR